MRRLETIEPDASASPWGLADVVRGLRDVRENWRQNHGRTSGTGGREFPSHHVLARIVEDLCGALFPMRLGPEELQYQSEDIFIARTLDITFRHLRGQIRLELSRTRGGADDAALDLRATGLVREFAASLPGIRAQLDSDVEAAFRGDPAARSVDEVVLCYPGITAVIHHRLAHRLYQLGLPLIARIIAERAHARTGIDIHPGATIGDSFFIDHGTGVVIGETAVIGNNVRIYQAVTLGAKSFPAEANGRLQKGLPRHPIIEDDVVIYAGTTILGRITIGRGSVIGGNAWITHGVPPNSQVTQASVRSDTSAVGI